MRADPVSPKATLRDAKRHDAAAIAASYVDWLTAAGADVMTCDAPTSWLEKETSSDAITSEPSLRQEPAKTAARVTQAPATKFPAQTLPHAEWPRTLDSLREMQAAQAPLPGNQYGKGAALPRGNTAARYMLMLDLPEREDLSASEIASGAQGRLITNMMRAIRIDISDCYITSLACSRPATGALPDADLPMLAEFARHQIELVGPELLFLFGSSASGALLGADQMNARGNLQYFNHNNQNVAALTTFHPRTLLARPQMKVQAWRDLQLFDNQEV